MWVRYVFISFKGIIKAISGIFAWACEIYSTTDLGLSQIKSTLNHSNSTFLQMLPVSDSFPGDFRQSSCSITLLEKFKHPDGPWVNTHRDKHWETNTETWTAEYHGWLSLIRVAVQVDELLRWWTVPWAVDKVFNPRTATETEQESKHRKTNEPWIKIH